MRLATLCQHWGLVPLNVGSSIVFPPPPYNIFHTLYLRALYKAINYLQWSDGMKADMTAIIYSATSRTQLSEHLRSWHLICGGINGREGEKGEGEKTLAFATHCLFIARPTLIQLSCRPRAGHINRLTHGTWQLSGVGSR